MGLINKHLAVYSCYLFSVNLQGRGRKDIYKDYPGYTWILKDLRTQGRMVNATRLIDGRIVETTRKVGSIPITSNCPAMSRVLLTNVLQHY